MISRTPCSRSLLLCAGLCLTAAGPASASFITWEVNEVFSNADGTIQFIEVFESNGQDGQRSFDGKRIETYVDTTLLEFHTFNTDLPSNFTANQFALIATQGFENLPGAVQPDFIMPDGFIDPSVVDRIRLGSIDEFQFAAGAIPTDGINSLYRTGAPTGINSPTNFAGQTGSIDLPEPATGALAVSALLCLAALRALRNRTEGCASR